MNQCVGQRSVVLRNEKNILVVEETTSAGRCGSSNAASSCPASICFHKQCGVGHFLLSERRQSACV